MLSPEVQKGVEDAREALLSAQRPGIGTSLRRARVSKALTELHVIENNSCRSEADVGYCRAIILLSQCMSINDLCNSDMVKRDIPQLIYQVEEALLTWSWLFEHSQYQQPDSAIQLREAMGNLLTFNSATLTRQDLLYGVQTKLTRLSRSCKDPFIAAFHLEVTHVILEESFHQSIRLFEEGRWAPAMSLLQSKDSELDVLVELEEKNAAQSLKREDYSKWGLSGDRYEEDRAGMLRRDFDMQMAMCKGSQLIHMGDLHFKEAMNGDPDDMMARALLAQDDYRAALGWVTGQDVELEGSALTRLARFHGKITKMPVSAHALYLRAVQLAAALQPAFPKGDWYKESTEAVQAYRDALQAEEAKKWEKLREPILEKLSEDIAKLNGAKDMDNFKFAEFIYKTWPPKTEGPAEPPTDPEDPNTLSKKHLLKVIQRYHSDKNITWGDDWRVMSEEISKCLTSRYNVMKGV